jgi:hypothetical protein
MIAPEQEKSRENVNLFSNENHIFPGELFAIQHIFLDELFAVQHIFPGELYVI